MNSLDLARAFFARTWKTLAITAVTITLLTLSLSALGFGGTVALLSFLGLYLAVQFKGTEIYFWATKRVTRLYDKVNAWWTPIWNDITGEAKAVADARATFNSAKAARKVAKKELKQSRKAVKQLAKNASKVLEAQLIAAGNGEDVTDLTVTALNARKDADQAVAKARLVKARYNKAFLKEYLAELALYEAAKTYRNSKSEAASTS